MKIAPFTGTKKSVVVCRVKNCVTVHWWVALVSLVVGSFLADMPLNMEKCVILIIVVQMVIQKFSWKIRYSVNHPHF